MLENDDLQRRDILHLASRLYMVATRIEHMDSSHDIWDVTKIPTLFSFGLVLTKSRYPEGRTTMLKKDRKVLDHKTCYEGQSERMLWKANPIVIVACIFGSGGHVYSFA